MSAAPKDVAAATNQVSFKTVHSSFTTILGPSPSITLLHQDPDDIRTYHEACIFHPETDSVFITSNQIPLPNGTTNASTANKTVKISRLYDSPTSPSIRIEDATPPSLPEAMWNGGVNYGSGLLFCAQGSHDTPGGIVQIQPPLSPPYTTKALISSFHGRQFNSVNDVIVHPVDGSIWFTDPCYGFHQGIRPAPVLPCQVYRFNPETEEIRAVADGFVRCNGLCFSPDLATLYVTDTGAIHGSKDVPIDPAGANFIYAFTVKEMNGSAFLTERRLFAYAAGGCPDGIKCDMEGNVYSGCKDGVEVWNQGGSLIGTILVAGGVANFCFGKEGALYMCNETKVWKAQLGNHVKGALLGL